MSGSLPNIVMTNYQASEGAAGSPDPTHPFATLGLTDTTGATYDFYVSATNGASITPAGGSAANSQSFTGTAAGFATYLNNITVTGAAGGTYSLQLSTLNGNTFAAEATFSGPNSANPAPATQAATFVACYLRGTLIATPAGEVVIESLSIGDMVATANGAARAVKWVAKRAYQNATMDVQPICIRAGAIADCVPSRDLMVSPQHAMLVEGVLVPAVKLVNGLSIVQCYDFGSVEYVHIELDSHDVVIANGAPSETYSDTENRWMFQNAAEFDALYPNHVSVTWSFCAPRVEEGAQLAAIHAKLAARASKLPGVTSSSANLFLLADGQPVLARQDNEGHYSFRVDAVPADLRIMSRRGIPAQLGLADDARPLGVSVRSMTLRSESMSVAVDPSEPSLIEGFYEVENGHRWTNGAAVLPSALLSSLSGPFDLDIEVDALAFYPTPVAGALAA